MRPARSTVGSTCSHSPMRTLSMKSSARFTVTMPCGGAASPAAARATAIADSPIALSASADSNPPCAVPRELQCASRTSTARLTFAERVRTYSGSHGSVSGLRRVWRS